MGNRINILFLTVQLGKIGGSERVIYDLVSNLDREIFNPHVAWLVGHDVLKDFKKLDISLHYIPKIRKFDLKALNNIDMLIKDNCIQIVNAHHFMPMFYAYYGCKVANNIKLFYTEHSQWEVERITGKWLYLGKLIFNKLDGIIGVNKEVSYDIQSKFNLNSNKIRYIKNGVNIQAFVDNKIKNQIKRKIGIVGSEKLIGIVANLKINKNHIFLLRAFREVIEEIGLGKVKLLIVGEGDINDPSNSENELRAYVDKYELNETICFLGYRSDIPDILSTLDIFCLTSVKEGLPVSLIEAMATGIPVIGSNVEGIREVIVPNENGFLVNLGDVIGLKNALLTLLNNEATCSKFGLNSQKFAAEKYSLNRCVEQYQNLFINSLGPHKRI